jgi:hypothetical protein
LFVISWLNTAPSKTRAFLNPLWMSCDLSISRSGTRMWIESQYDRFVELRARERLADLDYFMSGEPLALVYTRELLTTKAFLSSCSTFVD